MRCPRIRRRRPARMRGHALPGLLGQARTRCGVLLEDAVAHQGLAGRRTPSSTFDVSMPHTTAPIGSLIGKTLGRSARSTIDVGLHPGLERSGDASPAGDARAVDRGVPDHVARAHQLGSPALPASLRSNRVACCTEIVARIWAKRSPGVRRSSSTPRPGRMSRSISCWIGGAPKPLRPCRSRAPARSRPPRPRSRRRPRRRARPGG